MSVISCNSGWSSLLAGYAIHLIFTATLFNPKHRFSTARLQQVMQSARQRGVAV